MLQTPRVLEHLAVRIERAYLRRRPEWRQASLDPRLWSAAAAVLLDAHKRGSWAPVDPELFVASQVAVSSATDPWTELTRAASRRRYLTRVRRLVRSLRSELRLELRRIETAMRRGAALEVIVLGPSQLVSPMSRYLSACRHGRPDLADRLRPEARDQHWACPLYRPATRGLIPDDDYPVGLLVADLVPSPGNYQFSLN